MSDRWTDYGGDAPEAGRGWTLETLNEPSRLWGANGIIWGPSNQLMVTQVFGSQVTAIDVNTGVHTPFAALGEGINAPDDGAFGYEGTFFATEPMNATVSARRPDGSYQVLSDQLPGANGMTVSHDRRRLFVDEFRPGGRLLELDPAGERDPVVLADDLAMPNAFAMGPDGALWFPQVIAGEIWRYDLDNGTLRLGFEDLATPTAVKFDDEGRLLTSEAGSGELTRIELSSGARETLARVNPGIDNFAIGEGGRLFVSHFTDGRVAEVTGGQERVLSPSGLIGPFGLHRRAGGSIVVGDGLAVTEVQADGSARCIMNLIADLPSMAIDVAELDGDVLVLVERGQVFRKPAGGGRAEPVAGRLRHAVSMTDSGDGGVLVVESGGNRVARVDGSGVTGVVAAGIDRPHSASVAEDGTVWVTHPGGATGFLEGRPVGAISGVADPHGIAVAGGSALIADPANRRVVAHDLARGENVDALINAPMGPPVAGAKIPHAASPLAVDGSGFLVGCDGDGTIRRLVRS